jgi:dTMP kinase
MKDRGLFIVLEGIDGSGTTSVSRQVTKELENKRVPVVWTREPSDGPIGRLMRQVLKGDLPLDKRATIGLFVADRWWHVDHIVKPALAAGKVVICDRYAYSTWVYQQDAWKPSLLREIMADLLAPDSVFVLDCPVQEAQRRKTPDKEMFDDADAQERYRSRYQNLLAFDTFKLGQEKIVLVDALKSDQATVVQTVLQAVMEARRS